MSTFILSVSFVMFYNYMNFKYLIIVVYSDGCSLQGFWCCMCAAFNFRYRSYSYDSCMCLVFHDIRVGYNVCLSTVQAIY